MKCSWAYLNNLNFASPKVHQLLKVKFSLSVLRICQILLTLQISFASSSQHTPMHTHMNKHTCIRLQKTSRADWPMTIQPYAALVCRLTISTSGIYGLLLIYRPRRMEGWEKPRLIIQLLHKGPIPIVICNYINMIRCANNSLRHMPCCCICYPSNQGNSAYFGDNHT